MPSSAFRRVDLPAPLGPRIATNWPPVTSRLTSRHTTWPPRRTAARSKATALTPRSMSVAGSGSSIAAKMRKSIAQAICARQIRSSLYCCAMPRPSPVTDEVRRVFEKQERHAWSIDELHDNVRSSLGSADYSSVFRAVSLLEKQGLIDRIDLGEGPARGERVRGAGRRSATGAGRGRPGWGAGEVRADRAARLNVRTRDGRTDATPERRKLGADSARRPQSIGRRSQDHPPVGAGSQVGIRDRPDTAVDVAARSDRDRGPNDRHGAACGPRVDERHAVVAIERPRLTRLSVDRRAE